MKRLALTLSFIVVTLCLKATTFYVSPTGSDTNLGTISSPFETITKARDAVKALGTLTQDAIVYLRGGSYNLSSTIVFDATNSGTGGFNVIYQAYSGEKPIINGGTTISNWQPYKNGIWKASVTSSFRNLYVNGAKAQRGRYPDVDQYLQLPDEPTTKGFVVQKGIIDNIANPSTNPIEFSGNVEWMSKKMRISATTALVSNTEITINPIEWNSYTNGPQGWRFHKDESYWFENALEFVDSEGEWFLDKSTNTVYYYPRCYENMTTATVVAGGLINLFKLNGATSLTPVHNISFKGIKFEGTGWTRPDVAGFIDVQGNSLVPANLVASSNTQYRHALKKDKMPGAIHVLYGNYITIDNCEFKNIAAGGIVFEEGGNNITIQNNTLMDIGGNGIEIGSDYYKAVNKTMFHKAVVIKNNYLENIANEYYGGVGILAYYITGLTIENNWVKNTSYSGISAGWGWNAGEAVAEAQNYTIRNNRVENYMRRLRDGGGIYVTNPIAGTNVIDRNYLLGNPNCFLATSGTIGIYHDGASSNWTTQNNVMEMFRQPLSLQTLSGQEVTNITVNNNYTTPNAISYTGVETNVVLSNNINLTSPTWDITAQGIINNAGLSDKSILQTFELEVNITNFYKEVYMGNQTNFTIELTNNGLSKNIDIQMELPKGVVVSSQINESFTQGQKKLITIVLLAKKDAIAGYFSVPVVLKWGDGYTLTKEIGLKIIDPLSTIVGIKDAGYKEVGTFGDSGLAGYDGTSRYSSTSGANVTWTPNLPSDGNYKVSIYRLSHATNADSQARINVVYNGGVKNFTLNYTEPITGWYELGTFPMKAGTSGYVKITKSTYGLSVRSSAVSFVKVETSTGIATTNIAKGKLTNTSSTNVNGFFAGAMAVDGNYTSNNSWISATNATAGSPQWIEIDLGAGYTIDSLNFTTNYEGCKTPISDFQFQRLNGTTWIDVLSETDNTLSFYTKKFSSVTTNKVRLLITNTATLVRLNEIEVYGSIATAINIPTCDPNKLLLYPNPLFNSDLSVLIRGDKLKNEINFTISDITGRTVYQNLIKPENTLQKTVNIHRSLFSSGVYLVKADNYISPIDVFKLVVQ